MTHGVALHPFVEGQRRLQAVLRERFGASLIVVSAVPPMGRFPALPQPLRWYLGARATRLDRALRECVGEIPHCVHLPQDVMAEAGPMASDGFHPAPAMYDSWASRIARIVADRAEHTTP